MNRSHWLIASASLAIGIAATLGISATQGNAATPKQTLTCATGWTIDRANRQCDGPISTLPDGYKVEQVTGPGPATMVTWVNAAGTITGCSGLNEAGHVFTC